MSTVKKEARLSGMLLARKGSAQPAHTDHKLNIQAFEKVHTPPPREEIKTDRNDGSMLAEAVKEINKVTRRQYNQVVTEEDVHVKPVKEKVDVQTKKNVAVESDNIKPAKRPVGAGKRIAMTLRMEQDEHLKLRLYAAHSRKSCQEIISEALEAYLSEDDKVCGLSECNCLKKNK